MKIDLTGRVAVITGGARGIGREIAATLAGCGARVAIVDRDQADAAARALGGEARGFACDVSDVTQVTAVVEEIEKAFGQIDVLVNNAGITRDNLLMRMKDEEWDAVLNVNLRAAFAMTRAVSRGMMKRRYGRIINIASVVGLTGNKGQANYAASKAGLIGMTKTVAQELASRNVLANAVAPGYIATEMTRALSAEAQQAIASRIPIERLGTPADVASVVAFLASEYAGYITGQVFVVDGGLVM